MMPRSQRTALVAQARNTAPTRDDLYRHIDRYVPNMLAWLDGRFEINDAGCWIWSGAPTAPMGYGCVGLGPRQDHLVIYAHRMSYMVHRGDPCHLYVLHRCDVPLCICPDHLFLGTAGDNIRDAVAKGRHRNHNIHRTHCKNGHPLEGDNVRLDGGRFRRCIACQREYRRQWRAINR